MRAFRGCADTLHGKILVFSGRERRQRNYRLAALRSSARRHDCAHETVAVAARYRCSQREVAQLQLLGNGSGDMRQGFRGGVRLRIDLQKIFTSGSGSSVRLLCWNSAFQPPGTTMEKSGASFGYETCCASTAFAAMKSRAMKNVGRIGNGRIIQCRCCSAVGAICFTTNSVAAVLIFQTCPTSHRAVAALLCRGVLSHATRRLSAVATSKALGAVLRRRVER